ncbi:MAG: glycosyltransferase [Actinobacteria bacterium]|nr:glycosyltransferase [Actinomycetota bacterium]
MDENLGQGRTDGFAGTDGDPALAAGRGARVGGVRVRPADRIRALWYSNAPWAGTGYGQQTQQAVQRLIKDGHEIAVHSNYGLHGATSNWGGIKIYPGGFSTYSDDIIAAHWQEWTQSTDLVKLLITLFDVWVFKAQNLDKVPNIASWVPVDHAPCPPEVVAWCMRPNVMPIAMSQFGHKMLENVGVRSVYVPHAIESVFKPTPHIVDNAGKKMTGRQLMGWEDDRFVVMMTAANKGVHPPRKAFAENLMAFGMFAQKNPDAVLYMHTDETPGMGGIDLTTLLMACGIDRDRVKFADPYMYRLGYPQNALAALYSAADVLLATSMGEGFGVPVIEAQACGTRVIVSNFSAQPELLGDGWLVEGQPFWDAAQKSWFLTPSVPSIISALNEAVKHRGVSQQAVTFAGQYDADLVYDKFWKPALKEIVEWCRSSQS